MKIKIYTDNIDGCGHKRAGGNRRINIYPCKSHGNQGSDQRCNGHGRYHGKPHGNGNHHRAISKLCHRTDQQRHKRHPG